MSPHKLIKKEGLGRLRGHWPAALGALLIPAAVGTLLAMAAEFLYVLLGFFDDPAPDWLTPAAQIGIQAAVIAAALVLLLLTLRPLMMGAHRWFCALAFGNDTGSGTVLYYFRPQEYAACLRYTLQKLGYAAIRAIPTAVGAIVLWAGLVAFVGDVQTIPTLLRGGLDALSDEQFIVLADTGVLAALLGAVGLLIWCLPLFLADYLFITARRTDAVSASAALMRPFCATALRLIASFWAWGLLSLLVFPLLFVLPYFMSSMAVAQKWMVYQSQAASNS